MHRLIFLLLLTSCAATRPTVSQQVEPVVRIMIRTFESDGTAVRPRVSSGTGFVVAERESGSVIVTAAHVVNLVPGSTLKDKGRVWTVLQVEYVAVRGDAYCALDVLYVGDEGSSDIAVVGCTGGEKLAPPATLTEEVPSVGAEVLTVGHPAGVPVPIVTVGYHSGELGSYLVASVAATGGSSGSPVYFGGRVYGVLVRVSTEFGHISLLVPISRLRLL